MTNAFTKKPDTSSWLNKESVKQKTGQAVSRAIQRPESKQRTSLQRMMEKK